MPVRRPLEVRFWPKVDRHGPEPEYRPELGNCWLWTAITNDQGYGQIGEGGKHGRMLYAHRLSYEWAVGPIPTGLVIDHLCRVRNCVRPSHLEAVSQRENIVLRGISSISTIRHRQDACVNGHAFTAENTWMRLNLPSGVPGRVCRECHRARDRAAKDRKRGGPPREMPFGPPVPGARHGHYLGYISDKCRCEGCRIAWRGYSQRYRKGAGLAPEFLLYRSDVEAGGVA